MEQETIRISLKQFFDTVSEESPLSLDILNNAVCVCLAAHIIAVSEESNIDTLSFGYWMNVMRTRNLISLRDLLYDVVYPNVRKDLRDAVDVLSEKNIDPKLLTSMINELFHINPTELLIQGVVNHIASYYYPLVAGEAVDTPTTINNLCLSILNPVDGSFYDGVSGIGSTCIAAYKHSKNHNGNIEIFAQEKLSVLCAVSVVRAYVNRVENVTIYSGDVLTSPQFLRQHKVMQFDLSIMFPPLSLSWSSIANEVRYDKYGRFSWPLPPQSNSEWLFVLHQLASLKEGTGRGIIAVSTGTLFNSANKHFRQMAIDEGYIECIITLPSNILSFTTTPLSLVVINKAKKRNSAILMVLAEGLFVKDNTVRVVDQLNVQVMAEIASLYTECRSRPGVSRLIEYDELIQEDCLLLPSRYILSSTIESEFGKIAIDFSETKAWPALEKISETIYRGINVSQIATEQKGGSYKIINYADVQNGKVDICALKSYELEREPSKYMVRPGDVLVSCKGVVIKTCVVPDHTDNVLLSINFIGIRLNAAKCDPRYLKYYLDSPIGQTYLKGRQVGTSIITLKNKDLAEMPISLPPIEKQKIIISKYEEIYKSLSDEIQRLYRHLTHEKWQFYKSMGLENVLIKREDESYEHATR